MTLEAFRAEVRGWLADHLVGEFAALVGTGGPGREHEHVELIHAWLAKVPQPEPDWAVDPDPPRYES